MKKFKEESKIDILINSTDYKQEEEKDFDDDDNDDDFPIWLIVIIIVLYNFYCRYCFFNY